MMSKRFIYLILIVAVLTATLARAVAPLLCSITGTVINADGSGCANCTIVFQPTSNQIQIVGGGPGTPVSPNPATSVVSTTTDGNGNLNPVSLVQGAGFTVTITNQQGAVSAPVQVVVGFVTGETFAQLLSGNFLQPGTSQVNGLSVGTTTITTSQSPYAVQITDFFIDCNASGGPVTITLPASAGGGRWLSVRKTDPTANACTIAPNSPIDTIDAQTSWPLTYQWDSTQLNDTTLGSWAITGPTAATGFFNPICAAAVVGNLLEFNGSAWCPSSGDFNAHSITGTGTNPYITGFGTINTLSCGASGSQNQYTCTINAGSNQLVCTTATDFQVNNGVLVPLAGAANTYATPTYVASSPQAEAGNLIGTGYVSGSVTYQPGEDASSQNYGQPPVGYMFVQLSTAPDNSTNVTVNYTYNGTTAITNEVVGAANGGTFVFGHQLLCEGAGVCAGGINQGSVTVHATVASATVTATDAGNTTPYQYRCSLKDALGGMSAASALSTPFNNGIANALGRGLYPGSFEEISINPATANGLTCWRTNDHGNTWIRLGTTPSGTFLDTGSLDVSAQSDPSLWPGGVQTALPTPPNANTNEWMVSEVTAVSADTKTLTLAQNAINTATGVTVVHDDTEATQDCINQAGPLSAASEVYAPPGHYMLSAPIQINSMWGSGQGTSGSPNGVYFHGGVGNRSNGGTNFARITGDALTPTLYVMQRAMTMENMSWFNLGVGQWNVQQDAINVGTGAGPWVASTPTDYNTMILPTVGNAGNYIFLSQSYGTTGTSQPTWPQTPFATVTDTPTTGYPVVWRNIGTITGVLSDKNTYLNVNGYGGQGVNSGIWLLGHIGNGCSTGSTSESDLSTWSRGQNVGYGGVGSTRWGWRNLCGGNTKVFSFYDVDVLDTQSAFDWQGSGTFFISHPTTASITGDGVGGTNGECIYKSNGANLMVISAEDESGTGYGVQFACGGSPSVVGEIALINDVQGSNFLPNGYVIDSPQNLTIIGSRFSSSTNGQCAKVRGGSLLTAATLANDAIYSVGNSYGGCPPGTSVFYSSNGNVNIGPTLPAVGQTLVSLNDMGTTSVSDLHNQRLPAMNFTATNSFLNELNALTISHGPIVTTPMTTANVTVNFATGDYQKVTVGGSHNIVLTGCVAGQQVMLEMASSTGNTQALTVSGNDALAFKSGSFDATHPLVTTQPTWTATNNKTDSMRFFCRANAAGGITYEETERLLAQTS